MGIKILNDSLQQMLGEMSQLESVRGLINEAKQLAGNQEELNKAIEEAANNPELIGPELVLIDQSTLNGLRPVIRQLLDQIGWWLSSHPAVYCYGNVDCAYRSNKC